MSYAGGLDLEAFQDMEEDMEDPEYFPDYDYDDDMSDQDGDDDYELYVEDMDPMIGASDDDEDQDDFEYEGEEEEDVEEEEADDGEDASRSIGGITFITGAANTAEDERAAEAFSALLRLIELPSHTGPRTMSATRRAAIGRALRIQHGPHRNRPNMKTPWWEPQREPHPHGLALLRSGEFGRVEPWITPSSRLGGGKARLGARTSVKPSGTDAVPNTNGTTVASYSSIPYVGQYAGEDYGRFYTATQNFAIHLYDTTQSKSQEELHHGNCRRSPFVQDPTSIYRFGHAPLWIRREAEDSSLKKIKSVQGVIGQWTVTDCDADKTGERMIYSSITPQVHLLHTAEDDADHVQLDFAESRRQTSWRYENFGIWSIRFSADGKEVVAGASDGKIMVYDIAAERRSLNVAGHADDVNAVCFADESSTNILVSGSDDGYVKVWDRRSLSSSTPAGILVGATQGITYTSPKGDGRYIIANSKDQALRLYDLRKMRSPGEFRDEPDAVSQYGFPHFDYRVQAYPRPTRLAHPKDCSVMTFRGHSVHQTLIRCHFSPKSSTGQSYIYSGSCDGMIHIWSIDGRVVQVLNRAEATGLYTNSGGYSDPSAPEPVREPDPPGRTFTVRDVAWHGFEPTLMSTCWETRSSRRGDGSIAKHEWKGLGKGGLKRLEDWVEKDTAEKSR